MHFTENFNASPLRDLIWMATRNVLGGLITTIDVPPLQWSGGAMVNSKRQLQADAFVAELERLSQEDPRFGGAVHYVHTRNQFKRVLRQLRQAQAIYVLYGYTTLTLYASSYQHAFDTMWQDLEAAKRELESFDTKRKNFAKYGSVLEPATAA